MDRLSRVEQDGFLGNLGRHLRDEECCREVLEEDEDAIGLEEGGKEVGVDG